MGSISSFSPPKKKSQLGVGATNPFVQWRGRAKDGLEEGARLHVYLLPPAYRGFPPPPK